MAQPTAISGMHVDVYAEIPGPTAMAWGAGGAFGADLYVATGAGDVYRVNTAGEVIHFATGLLTPTGLAFAQTPEFGELLYATEIGTGLIRTIDSAGAVGEYVMIDEPSVNLSDLAFGPGEAGFSTDLYVSDAATLGAFPGRLYRVDATGNVTTLFDTDPYTGLGMTFSIGGPFGSGLIIADPLNYRTDDGGVRLFDPAGGFAVIASTTDTDLFSPGGVAMGPGGAFGNDLYVADFGPSAIYTVSPGGQPQEFATGFTFGQSGYEYDADLLFSHDGSFLLVTDFEEQAIYRIGTEQPPCFSDCDGTGTLDIFDFLCFQNAFDAGDPAADCDGDGTLDIFDFLCFQNEFEIGCP